MKRKGVLTAQDIQAAVDAAGLELARAGIEEKLCVPFRLALEEVLLLYRNKLGESAPYTLICNKNTQYLFSFIEMGDYYRRSICRKKKWGVENLVETKMHDFVNVSPFYLIVLNA